MNTYTGGTWCCNEVGEICTRDNIIAEIVGYDNSGPGDTYEDAREEIEANGRLIAAAPELLEALQAVTATYRTFRNVPADQQEWTVLDDEALAAAFAAIAKATPT